MFEIDWVKLLIIGAVTAIVMAPEYWNVMDRWIISIRRSQSW